VKVQILQYLVAVVRERGCGILQFVKIILVVLTAMGLNFLNINWGGLHEKHAVTTRNKRTIPPFA
jgi:hypothetical protein